MRDIYRLRSTGLIDPGSILYNTYRVPDPLAPYPQDYVIGKQGRIRYWEREYDPRMCIHSIDDLLVEIPPVTVSVVPDSTQVSPGGQLGYTVTLVNETSQIRSFDAEVVAVLSDSVRHTLRGPFPVSLDGEETFTVHLTDPVPTYWPLGASSLKILIGPPQEDSWDVGGFKFEVE